MSKVKILLTTIFILILLALVQQNQSNKINYNIQKFQIEFKKLKESNSYLNLDYESQTNLEYIYNYATTSLNMVFPEKIIYVPD